MKFYATLWKGILCFIYLVMVTRTFCEAYTYNALTMSSSLWLHHPIQLGENWVSIILGRSNSSSSLVMMSCCSTMMGKLVNKWIIKVACHFEILATQLKNLILTRIIFCMNVIFVLQYPLTFIIYITND